MSAQTTASRQAGSLHNGALVAALTGAVALIAAIAFAVALLGSPARPVTPAAARPVFNAPAFRAEEHHLRVTSPIAKGVQAEQRSAATRLPSTFGGNAPRADEMGWRGVPSAFDANAFRAEERDFRNHNR